MKKQITAISAVVLMAAMAQTALADGGKVTFEGGVTSTTCKVNVNDSGSNNATVKLPVVSSQLFKSVGSTAGLTNVKFELSGCTLGNNAAGAAVSKASVYYEPGNTVNPAGQLNNQADSAAGGATGIDLQLLDAENKVIDINSDVDGQRKGSPQNTPTFVGGVAVINHAVRYISTDPTVGVGKVTSNVEYVIHYE